MSLLTVEHLDVHYGSVHAVRDAAFHVDEGELVVIVGANGGGKSSIMRAVSGLVKSRGSIAFDGRDLSRTRADARTRAGLCQVPEGRRIFGAMSVLENLQVAAWGTRRRVKDESPRIYELFPILEQRAEQTAATLSGGEQQMLALSRALIRRPRLLMLDEPSMGLAPLIVAQMFELIAAVNRDGTSVLLVEQNATQALSIADRGYVMETGRLSGGGDAQQMLQDTSLHEAYFGRARDHDTETGTE
ncbi:ABC transporter ATP-binding protein [Agromyces silvae]|uniref:ABC transporter ATP-binding protein n=1 Tax=Agromyces silvae TaxID=3388266 RepID=UPI00280C2823|nr:ABC transporter ATP-binding protein [Agromyces protaetiae]